MGKNVVIKIFPSFESQYSALASCCTILEGLTLEVKKRRFPLIMRPMKCSQFERHDGLLVDDFKRLAIRLHFVVFFEHFN